MTTNLTPTEYQALHARCIPHMSDNLLKKVIFAKEASREYQRQNLLATAWKIEEIKRHLDLLEAVQEEHKHRFEEASIDLEAFRSVMVDMAPSHIKEQREQLLKDYDTEMMQLYATDRVLDRLVKEFPDGVGSGGEREMGKL